MISYETGRQRQDNQDDNIQIDVLPEIIRKRFKLGDDFVRHYAIKTPKWG